MKDAKGNLFYPAVHITEVMETIGRRIDDTNNYSFSLRDLDDRVGKYYAERVLSGAVNSVVHRRTFGDIDRFEWDAKGDYAPDIRFSVMSTDGLTMDEDGFLDSPIRCARANLILQFLNFDFRGNTADALVAWGNHTRTDLKGNVLCDDYFDDSEKEFCWWTGDTIRVKHNFHQDSTGEADNVLIVIPWGGAHSTTKGQCEETLKAAGSFERGLEFFQSRSSGKGGAGYDFYIIAIKKAVDEKAMAGFRFLSEESFNRANDQQLANRKAFLCKYLTFHERQKEFGIFMDAAVKIETEVNLCYETKVRKSLLAERSCVVLPDTVGSVFDYLKLPEQPKDYTCSLETLEKAKIPHETWDLLDVAENDLNAKIDAWLDFVPLYADLADVVVKRCHGEAEVYLNRMEMTLPNTYLEDPLSKTFVHRNCPATSTFATRKYAFSDTHLKACADHVEEFLRESQSSRKLCTSTIKKLVDGISENAEE